MPDDGGGVYNLPTNFLAVTGETITAAQHNDPFVDVASGLNARLNLNGSKAMTGALPMGGNRITGLARGLVGTDAPTLEQVGGGQLTDVASATTTDIGAAASGNVNITGTTTITGFGTVAAGTYRRVRFAGALTITHNATSLITTTGEDIETAAGDLALMISLGSGNWRMLAFLRGAGAGGITLGTITGASGTAVDFTGLPAGIKRLKVSFSGVSTNGSAGLLVQIGTSGGIQTTGYAGGVSSSFSTSATGNTSTAGILATDAVSAGTTYYGSVTFEIINAANGTFVATVTGGRSDLGVGYTGGGAKALGATLDRVRITTTNGTDTFDSGNINISYEV
jgi:hypothetical protein